MKEMELLCTIFFLISYALLVLLLIVTFLLLKICTGKSIKNPNYPPVKRTVFEQLFYLNKLYDHQTQVAKSQPTFRLLAPGQSEIFTADIRNIEHILKTNFDKYCKGEYNQEVLKDLLGRGIFASDGEQWRQQRKVASFEFSTRVVRDFSCSIFGSNAAKLVRVLQELTVSGQVFDMHDMLMRSTLDSILEIGFGIELNCLEGSNEEGAVFTKAFDDSNELIYWRIIDPFWKLKRVLNIGSEAVLKKNIRIIDSFVYNVISTKRKLLAMQREYCVVREDILSRFLAEKRKNPKVMNDQYLRDIILNFMIAGKDTSANALSWFLYMLCKNPLIQEKVAQEVRDVIGRKENDADIDNFMAAISDADLEQMHYLHAALTETLRLYPIIPLDGVRAKMDDILPDGYKVKKGDGVFYMAYAMGRMTYVWGDDACNFRPERWLNNGVFQPQSHFKFIAFHAGPRMCLGKNFAYRQMKIISLALLHHFRFKLADDKENLTYRTMLTLQVKGGLHLQAVPKTTNTQ